MTQSLSFNEALRPGTVETVLPGVRRVLCNNPSPMTERGTNTWLVGQGEVAVIDPGPRDTDHLVAILRATAGERIAHILVTHTHNDHSSGAQALADATGAPIRGFGAHPSDVAPSSDTDRAFRPDYRLNHNDVVSLGERRLRALHTPGHCSTHLCFALEPDGILFSGDHIMAWSTTAVAPPDGDMADYHRSLALVAGRNDRVCLAAHGAPILNPSRLAAGFAEFVQARENQVLKALRGLGRATAADIAEGLYGRHRIDRSLSAATIGLVSAHLRKLAREGAVFERDRAWVAHAA